MLPDKMESLVAARQELAASEVSNPPSHCADPGQGASLRMRHPIHCGRGTIAVAAHAGAGPVEVPSLDAKKELEFDWDMEVRMSERARTALEFMRTAVERYGGAGQPLWPVVPSSLYGAFLAGKAREALILVITFNASLDGWGAVVRFSPEEKGTEIVGGYRDRLAAPMLGRARGVCGSGSAPCMPSLAGVSGDAGGLPRHESC